jgi:hypothetical protein
VNLVEEIVPIHRTIDDYIDNVEFIGIYKIEGVSDGLRK